MASLGFMNRDFFELVKAIGESKSKQEEDRIITEEIAFLKKKIAEPGMNKKKMKEYVIRSIYVEMLGQDASFAYIKAVELCASNNIAQKRVGYLASSLFFSPEHEFRFMLINQIQRDLNSSNQLDCCAALSAVCKIITPDMIPAVLADILKLLKHDMDYVRKRAVVAFHRMFQMDHDSVQDHIDIIRRVLCDKDPAVMGASLVVLHDMIAENPMPFKDLVSSFTSILKQVTEHRLPREFDYHRIPAPWVQMNLLRIMAMLGRGDQASSEGMYEILVDVMRRADTGINVGYAIVYECVLTITTIYPNSTLLDAAATSISRFIRSDSHNLKYIGIKGLAAIVKDHPKYAADHQMAVIDCLEDTDETLKRKTLDLLFKMTNSVNVEFIVDKLLASLATATDDHFRTDLVARITLCAERFAPSNFWFVNTMVKIFELAGDKVKMSVAQTLLQLIAEGSDNNEDEEDDDEEAENEDEELRCHAVEDFLVLLEKPKLPSVLAQAMAWVLGEYGYLSETRSKEDIMASLCDLCRQSSDPITRSYTISAIMKLVAQCGVCPPGVLEFIDEYSHSSSLEVSQRCQEFQQLLSVSSVMVEVLPVDASCEDIEVDEHLSFLDQFIEQSLANGAVPYSPPSYLDDEVSATSAVRSGKETTSGFKIGAYEKPSMPAPTQSMILSGSGAGAGAGAAPGGDSGSSGGADMFSNLSLSTAGGAAGLQAGKGVASVWGRKPEPAAPAASSTTESSTAAANLAAMKQTPSATSSPAQSQTSAQTQVQAQEEPVVDEAAIKKQQMANALFGGGSSSSSSGRRSSSGARGGKRASSAKTSTQSPAAATTSEEPAPTTGGGDMFDLLDMGGPPPPVPQHHAAPVAPAPTSSASTSSSADMFGDMMVTAPSPQDSAPQTEAP
jgi:AP-4 complex subunit epsilon-1